MTNDDERVIEKEGYKIDVVPVAKWSVSLAQQLKNSNYKTYKSLDDFCKKYPSRIGINSQTYDC